MMLLWACAGVPLGAYNVAANFNVALQIQPQILTLLSLITWIQCYHYDGVSLIYLKIKTEEGANGRLLEMGGHEVLCCSGSSRSNLRGGRNWLDICTKG